MNEQIETKSILKVIGISSLGTLIEWYDFYIFGSLAVVLSTKFFPLENPTAAFLSTLATFGAGFVVRPFGALFFGSMGDLIGRKFTFIMTLTLMGGSTFLIGCIPSYAQWGYAAPALVLLLRLLQGLALGGQYGGAATYVAEHAPEGKRGYWTSWIQTTATLGLFVSLMVIFSVKNILTEADFDAWGWRIPFLLSIFLVFISFWIKRYMDESPVFQKAKKEGKTSKSPIRDSFGNKYNLKYILLALFGAVLGQGVIWYTGQFYAMTYMKKVMEVQTDQVDLLLGIALLIATPFFVFFGWLSDKVGRKWIMLLGMALAVITYRPIYEQMYQTTNTDNKTEMVNQTKVSSQKVSRSYGEEHQQITTKKYTDGTVYRLVQTTQVKPDKTEVTYHSNTKTITPKDRNMLCFYTFLQVLYITMVYGPIAAFLVDLFPAKLRYTSMSFPYHIGNGVFGGLLPAVSTYLVSNAQINNDPQFYLAGLWYPIAISGVCFIIGAIYIDKSFIKHK